MLCETVMKYVNWKASALFGTSSLGGGIMALAEGQAGWTILGFALGVMGFLFAMYRYPNDQALKEVKELREENKRLRSELVRSEVHGAALEQNIKESGIRMVPTKEDLEKCP